MNPDFLSLICDPYTKAPLVLTSDVTAPDGTILEGKLSTDDGSSYRVTRGVPRFVGSVDEGQQQTANSFGFKWHSWSEVETPSSHAPIQQWLVERYFATPENLSTFLRETDRILDVGCGSGLSARILLEHGHPRTWVGVDISLAIDVAQRVLGERPYVHFAQADMMNLPFAEVTFDAILAEGTLHHTPSTHRALLKVASLLAPGGVFLFYVYRRKGPIREFADDHIRDQLSVLPPEEALEQLRSLTEFGRAPAELRTEVTVPDVPLLGVQGGRYDVQRLFYWNVAKAFWNDSMSFEENLHINFDWYHPRYAHRQSETEVREWCEEAGVTIERFHAEEAGFTVHARLV